MEYYKTKQYDTSVLKQCGLNLLYGGTAVQKMLNNINVFDSVAFKFT